MHFQSKQIRGEGRGHTIGFPTINLVVPDNFSLEDGVYAVKVTIESVVYKGAFHYGSIPTFDQPYKTMEVYLLDITDETVPKTEDVPIKIELVSRIRGVWKFTNGDELSTQIAKDVENVRAILE